MDKIVKNLDKYPHRYFKEQDILMINGDCLEVMEDMEEKSIDTIITDIPYGTTACSWDNVIPFEPMWKCLNKLIKDNGAIALFGSEPFSSHLRMSNIKNFKYDWIWEKNRPTGMFLAKKQPMKYHEIISVFNSKIYFPQMWRGNPSHSVGNGVSKSYHYDLPILKDRLDSQNKYPKSICVFDRPHPPIHPTQKPIELLEYLIKTYTNENEIVLDFTSGSGTAAIASFNTKRKCICIEKDVDYFNASVKRCEEHFKQMSFNF